MSEQMDWRQAAAARGLKVTDLAEHVGTSIGGQNNRFNNIQIDGGVNNDLFGLAGSGTPGGLSSSHWLAMPISASLVP